MIRVKIVAASLAISIGLIPAISQAIDLPASSLLIGGKIAFSMRCSCNLNPSDRWILVTGPKPGSFMKVTTTNVYDHKNLSMGSNVVGKASSTDYTVCKIYAGTTCITFGGGPKIKMIGTSKGIGGIGL